VQAVLSTTELTCRVDGGAPGLYNLSLTVGEGTGASAPGAVIMSSAFEMLFNVTGRGVTPQTLNPRTLNPDH
jgi:hypothetical protein